MMNKVHESHNSSRWTMCERAKITPNCT